MRTHAIVLSSALLLSLAAPASADLIITELFHVDPGWEAGGYWEFTVTNTSGSDVYMVAVGNVGADLVAVRYPDLVGTWYPDRIDQETWDSGDWGHFGTEFTFPDTATLPFATYFPGSTQALVYYVLGANPPIPNGSIFTGFYFNYPIPAQAAAPRIATAGGSWFLAFNGSGEVVARGQTIGVPLATNDTTWGAIKAMYR